MIRKSRIYLRKLTNEDAISYHRISRSNDEQLLEYTEFFISDTLKQAKNFIDTHHKSKFSNLYGIFRNGDNVLMGAILLEYHHDPSITVSYFIGTEFRNHGYMSEALNAMLEHLSDKGSFIETVKFSVNINNTSSIRLQEKLGSTLYGISEVGNFLRYKKKI